MAFATNIWQQERHEVSWHIWRRARGKPGGGKLPKGAAPPRKYGGAKTMQRGKGGKATGKSTKRPMSAGGSKRSKPGGGRGKRR